MIQFIHNVFFLIPFQILRATQRYPPPLEAKSRRRIVETLVKVLFLRVKSESRKSLFVPQAQINLYRPIKQTKLIQ